MQVLVLWDKGEGSPSQGHGLEACRLPCSLGTPGDAGSVGRPPHSAGLMPFVRGPPKKVSTERKAAIVPHAFRPARLAQQLGCGSQSRDPAGVGRLTALALGVAAVEGVGGREGASRAGADAEGPLRVLVTRVGAEGIACGQQQAHCGSTDILRCLC